MMLLLGFIGLMTFCCVGPLVLVLGATRTISTDLTAEHVRGPATMRYSHGVLADTVTRVGLLRCPLYACDRSHCARVYPRGAERGADG